MKTIFFGRGGRGISCLSAFHEKQIPLEFVVSDAKDSFYSHAESLGYPVGIIDDPNSPEAIEKLERIGADVFILAGYGKILKARTIGIPRRGCINLHGGRLPQLRGSSPMNWALIRGDKEFSISIIQVSTGIDTGDVLLERTFPINENSSIKELHEIANEHFPQMLIEVHQNLDSLKARKQKESESAYFPLRFTEDGFIVWDLYTAQEIHNRIRALTDPYPCAFTFFGKIKIQLLESKLTEFPFYGESGRIYRRNNNGLLICAKDRCLWITKFRAANPGFSLDTIKRYDSFTTIRSTILHQLEGH